MASLNAFGINAPFDSDGEPKRLTPLQNAALLVKQTQAKLAALEYAQNEPIAVVGLGCRFPGDCDGPEAFWRLLSQGIDAVREVPPERWSIDDFYDADAAAPGKMNTRCGGFVSRVDEFDSEFFGISPREAVRVDPQHRLLLEVAWEASRTRASFPVVLRRARRAFISASSATTTPCCKPATFATWTCFPGPAAAMPYWPIGFRMS